MIRKLITNLTVLATTVVITIAALEICARIFYPEPVVETSAKQFMQHDELLGWKKISNHESQYVAPEFRTTMRLNSKGMRGPEFPYENGETDLRIVVLGDSYTEGYMVEFEEMFSEVLRNELVGRSDASVEVINLGTAGYSTDQELIFFQNEGKRYQQNLSVLMFYQNDIWYNSQDKYVRGYKPLFKMGENGLTLTNFPVPAPEARFYEKHFMGLPEPPSKKKNAGLVRRVKAFFGNHSRLYNFVVDRVKNSHDLYTLATKLGLAVDSPFRAMNSQIADEYRIWKTPYDEDIRHSWDLTKRLILELNREVESVDSRLLVSYIPNMANIYDDVWQATKRKYGLSDEAWSIERPRIELERFSERNGITFLDLTPIFKQEAEILQEQDKRLYYEVDGHWNVEGHALAGQVLADFIRSRILKELP